MATKQRLGEILIQEKLVSEETIEQALRTQVGGNRRLGHILVRMKAITADQLAESLSSQLGLPICDVSDRFTQDVKKTVPRYLCQQYGILPLALNNDNVLEVAMADPADDDAIRDLEKYTGNVIAPCLALQTAIEKEIPRRIPLGVKDVFSPRSNIVLTRAAVCFCLFCLAVLAGVTYNYIETATHGTKSMTADSIIYKNHDLMLGFDRGGKINLLGRGAFADGYYSVSFRNPSVLQSFLQSRDSDFSEKQKDWLGWVLGEQKMSEPTDSVAANSGK